MSKIILIFILWFGFSGSVIGSIVLPQFSNTIDKTIIMQEEIWKDIPNYEGYYQASNLGRIRSLDRRVPREKSGDMNIKGTILKPHLNSGGYYVVNLRKNGKGKSRHINQLVAEAFLNHIPNGHKIVVDHIDNVKTNNKLENLQLISNRENCSKERRGSSKYTGVVFHKSRGKWQSQIQIDGVNKYIGIYNCETAAHLAYQKELRRIL